MRRASGVGLALAILLGVAGWAAGAPRGKPPEAVVRSAQLPTYRCPRVSAPLRIDGVLDEAVWRWVPATPPFALSHGYGLPVQPTRLKACWDNSRLYLAFQCRDRDLHSPYTRRDEPLYEGEVVEAFLQPGPDPRCYFEFEVSPAGVLFDARVDNPRPKGRMTVETAWDAPGIRWAVKRRGTLNRRDDRDEGWDVEMAIPFADLKLNRPVRPGDRWRANFYRIDRGSPDEFSAWSPTLADPPNFHVPERFGRLVFAGTPRP